VRPPAPQRPAAVELATAILIVGSLANLVGTLGGGTSIGGRATPGPIVLGSVLLDTMLVVIGVAVRTGRWWSGASNVVAVVVFLYGTAALGSGLSEIPLVFSVLYGVVFLAVFLNRAWFDAMRSWRDRGHGRRP